jgi:hypothetical protein
MTKQIRALISVVSAITALGGLITEPAKAQSPPTTWTQVGMLSCKLNPSIGFVIFGHHLRRSSGGNSPGFPILDMLIVLENVTSN